MLYQDRTMVPLRFISESLGADVQWVEANNMVVITTKKDEPKPVIASAGGTGILPADAKMKEKYTITAATASVKGHNATVPENMIDGNMETNWTQQNLDIFVTFDLGSEKKVDCIAIAWGKGNERTQNFELQGSVNGKDFTPIVSLTSSGTTTEKELYGFPAQTVRYIRIINKGNSAGAWINIFEAEIGLR
ncbi:MAG: F5/8 type C domain protein [Firmicutes bacterium ADurb.Bin193]|nr:MAG: F5/8 type C domain protein [Firmicutes bacterium ADurb.Bin193]